MNETLIRQRFSQAAATNAYFAAVRLPDTQDVHFIYGNTAPLLLPLKNPISAKPYFVCSPYGAGNLGYVLEADSYYRNETLVTGTDLQEVAEQPIRPFEIKPNNTAEAAHYTNFVSQAVNHIRSGKVDKIVAARCEEISNAADFDLPKILHDLCLTYTHACVYFFHLPGLGTWMGATPEKLVSVQNNLLETVALAGTLPVSSDKDWSDKEYDEQNMTEFFIQDIFRSLKLEGLRTSEVETIPAGNVKHLRSKLTWKPKPDVLAQKFGKILNALNPTPAVCGLPQFESALFISQNEQMERRFYAGFIGLILQHESHLFVNLRCMEIGPETGYLYAGAGLTADSVPEAEWTETGHKMQTLKQILYGTKS